MPFQLLREQVEVRYTTTTVEVFFKGRRVSSHPRRYDGQPATVAEHMPSAHRAHAEWTPSRLIRWAEKVGPATGELVARILESRPHPEVAPIPVLESPWPRREEIMLRGWFESDEHPRYALGSLAHRQNSRDWA